MSAILPSIGDARLPETYERAKQALAECSRIDEYKDWADKAEALASYAKQAKDDGLRRLADRIQARAIRRCGELLRQFDARGGDRSKSKPALTSARSGLYQCSVCGKEWLDSDISECPYCNRSPAERIRALDAAKHAGLSVHQHRTAVCVANVPTEEFEAAVESENPPTVSQ